MARTAMGIAATEPLATRMRTAPVNGAATWVKGAVLIQNGSGELVEGGANPVNIVGLANAKHPPTNNWETDIGKHHPALPGVEFEASIDDNTALGTGAIAAADQYAAYGITEDANGVWYVDKGKVAVADVRVRITKLIDEVGTVNGRVRFVFLPIVNLATAPTRVTVFAGNQ